VKSYSPQIGRADHHCHHRPDAEHGPNIIVFDEASVYGAMTPCSGKERPMLIHSMLPRSTVNGPGARAVVWLQGCDLRCPGCFNPATHAFDRDRDKPCYLNHNLAPSAALWFLTRQGGGTGAVRVPPRSARLRKVVTIANCERTMCRGRGCTSRRASVEHLSVDLPYVRQQRALCFKVIRIPNFRRP
jgi:pyruvate-formate lyase-activating enzyme